MIYKIIQKQKSSIRSIKKFFKIIKLYLLILIKLGKQTNLKITLFIYESNIVNRKIFIIDREFLYLTKYLKISTKICYGLTDYYPV